MKTPVLRTLSFGLLTSLAFAADPAPTEVVYIDHATANQAFSVGKPLLVNSSYKVQAGRRVMPGEAEVHEHDTDIFYILEGTATFVTGGTVSEAKITGPGETRGKTITGGTARKLTKGDVIVVPAGVAHCFTEVPAPFVYYVVKVTR